MTYNKIWLKYSDNTHYTVCVQEPVDRSDFVEYELSQDEQRAESGVYG
jgi:hypothetical protein